jgi:hypothetical protein
MRSRVLLGLSLIATAAVVGCSSGGVNWTAVGAEPLELLSQASGRADAPTARGQKGEPAPRRGNPLNFGEDVPAVAREQRVVRVRATVNGDPILDEEVMAAAAQDLIAARTDKEKADALNKKLTEMIDRELVIQDAVTKLSHKGGERFLRELKKAAHKEFDEKWIKRMMHHNKLESEEDLKRFLRANGMPFQMIRRQWERNFISMEYMRFRIELHLAKIGHLQVAEYYEKHKDQFTVGDSARWQDLFVASARHPRPEDARKLAEALAERVKKGEDFVKLAKVYDNGESSLREQAEGIGHKHGEIKPAEAESVVFALRKGDVAVVEIENGFHVVRLLERQYAGLRPFDEKVQKEVKNKLRNEVYQRESKRIIDELKRRAIIEIATEVH